MGREIKRVPLDFSWPMNTVWEGFLNPHYEGHSSNCPECNGRGTTIARQRLEDLTHLIMISGSDSLHGKSHPWFDYGALYNTSGKCPSKDMAELTAGLAGRKPCSFLGHDACDRWSATKAIIKAAKLKESWGICKHCKGQGNVWDSKENKLKAARWRSKEPPKGKGYQLWETVSEGSPISPVFATPEELADWLTKNSTGMHAGTSREQWLKFICGPGWAPSFIGVGNKLMTGVEAVE
jgi:hypothetical protein